MTTKIKVSLLLMFSVMLLQLGMAKAEPPTPLDQGDHDFTIKVGDLDRHYVIHVPASYDGVKPTPIVIMLHGAGGKAEGALIMGKWIAKSELEGFLAVALDGIAFDPSKPPSLLLNPQVWNDGSGRGSDNTTKVDDVGFVNAVIDDLMARGKVDEQRIYVTGFSNGASMTFRVGVELSKRIAAIAPVSGHLWLTDATLDEPVSMQLITGMIDPLNPINGGPAKDPWTPGHEDIKPPMVDSVNAWAKMLNCPSKSTSIYNHDGVTGIGYSPCDGGSEVAYYTVEGMGHVWPGGRNYLPQAIVGPSSDKIDATDVIWTFFKSHPKVEIAATPVATSPATVAPGQ